MYATSYATATPLAAALVRVGGREPVGGLPSGGRWQLACSASATSGRCRCLRFLLPCELHVVRICLFTSVRGSPTFRTCLAVVGCPRGRQPISTRVSPGDPRRREFLLPGVTDPSLDADRGAPATCAAAPSRASGLDSARRSPMSAMGVVDIGQL